MTSHDKLFVSDYLKQLFPDSLTLKLYGRGETLGLTALLPFDAIDYIYPSEGLNIKISQGSYIPISWYPQPFADYYNIYIAQGTVSGFTPTYSLYKQIINDDSCIFIPTYSGSTTYWVKWKIQAVHQDSENSVTNVANFSYTRLGS